MPFRPFSRNGVVIPPAALMPAFLAAYITYEAYPWKFLGEWVELMLGLGFLFVAIVCAREFRARAVPSPAPLTAARRAFLRYFPDIFLTPGVLPCHLYKG